MQWDGSPNAGFCPPTVEPWLPIPADYQQLNVAIEREDPHSMLTLTRTLLEIRRTNAALSVGSYSAVENVPEDCFVYLRQFESQRYLIALNFSSQVQTASLAASGAGQLILSTYLDRQGLIDLTAVCLRGNEGCLIALAESME
jgi:alpha-glucosidase